MVGNWEVDFRLARLPGAITILQLIHADVRLLGTYPLRRTEFSASNGVY
jgi:hypothetical protein